MKTYCVTYYDGNGERQLYVQAKSIKAAKAAANDLLRKNKTIGASVRKAERVHWTVTNCTPKGDYLRASEVARIIKERR